MHMFVSCIFHDHTILKKKRKFIRLAIESDSLVAFIVKPDSKYKPSYKATFHSKNMKFSSIVQKGRTQTYHVGTLLLGVKLGAACSHIEKTIGLLGGNYGRKCKVLLHGRRHCCLSRCSCQQIEADRYYWIYLHLYAIGFEVI